jgi:imidazolonepropionase-like amidohydrolase
MKSLLCTLLCLFSLATVGQNLGLSGAQVVDVEKGKIISGQTVLIAEGKISQIGPDEKVIIPEGVTNLSLEGQYVIPGLIDAHIHIFQSGGLYTRPDAIDLRKFRPYKEERRLNRERAGDRLRRYLRAGITSVMDVGGPLSQFGLRDSLNQHADLAHWWLTGPLVSTYQPVAFQIDDSPILKANSPEEAREMVRAQLPYRPDFIKIWYIQFPGQDPKKSLPIVQATIEESHQHKLRVAVHATQLETASLAVGAGCDVLVHSVDNTLLPKAFVKELKKKEVVYVPTLIVSDKYREVFGQQNELSYEDFTLADPFVIGELFDLKHLPVPRLIDRYQDIAARQFERNQRSDSIRKANLKLLADAGALIATGTDAGNIGTQHVSSYYTELAAMAEAGLSLQQLLRYSTYPRRPGPRQGQKHGPAGSRLSGGCGSFGEKSPGRASNTGSPLPGWSKRESLLIPIP